MLIFRYYNDNNVLMEQENVPVIYDGNGIKEIIDYYLLTNTITTPSKITENWSLIPLTVTDKMRFCWKYSVIIKDNGARTETEPLICSTYGEKGERGAMYLGCFSSDSECEEKNGSAIFTNDFYLNSVSGYIRKVSKNEESLIWKDVDSTVEPSLYNLAMNDAIANLSSDSETLPIIKSMNAWIKTLTAKTAFIENLFAQNITLNNNGLIKSNNFVSGSTGFKIQYNGNAEFNNGTFNNINANGGTFNNINVNGRLIASNGFKFSHYINQNLYLPSLINIFNSICQNIGDYYSVSGYLNCRADGDTEIYNFSVIGRDSYGVFFSGIRFIDPNRPTTYIEVNGITTSNFYLTNLTDDFMNFILYY